MIYVDSSVVLSQLRAEDRCPPNDFWRESLVASRLVEYEVWTRLHAANLAVRHGDAARALLARLAFVELAAPVLARALEPYPKPVRTLDALHLASLHFLHARDPRVTLATYDVTQGEVAKALGIAVLEP